MKIANELTNDTDETDNPLHHTRKLSGEFKHLVKHLRDDVEKVNEPRAQALFETSAEVLNGLIKAFADYEKQEEKAWKRK